LAGADCAAFAQLASLSCVLASGEAEAWAESPDKSLNECCKYRRNLRDGLEASGKLAQELPKSLHSKG
jgi:hypothetical protein